MRYSEKIMPASESEVRQFLDKNDFTTYQKIDLPYGLEIPGKDHSRKIETIFKDNLKGKSVLDVGCYYGLYSHEAKNRGASKVVGVELNENRYAIAAEIARLKDNSVEIVKGDILEVDLGCKFDLVVFLSVLHHVKDPVEIMQRLASLCLDTVVVEFCLPDHRLRRKGHAPWFGKGSGQSLPPRFLDFYRKILVRMLGESVGLIVTGDPIEGEDGYDWTFFFNKTAFRTVFQIQNDFFSEIRFVPSPQKANRMLAFCKVPDPN
jgi:SAM-dependent methyltransferase